MELANLSAAGLCLSGTTLPRPGMTRRFRGVVRVATSTGQAATFITEGRPSRRRRWDQLDAPAESEQLRHGPAKDKRWPATTTAISTSFPSFTSFVSFTARRVVRQLQVGSRCEAYIQSCDNRPRHALPGVQHSVAQFGPESRWYGDLPDTSESWTMLRPCQ